MEYYFLSALLIFRAEAFRSLPYDDKTGKVVANLPTGGKITVGIGFNLTDSGLSFKESISILLSRVYDIDSLLASNQWFMNLNDSRKAAIIDMVYNMGIARFNEFVNTIKYLSIGNYIQASINILASDYAKQVPSRAERNAKIIRTGVIEL